MKKPAHKFLRALVKSGPARLDSQNRFRTAEGTAKLSLGADAAKLLASEGLVRIQGGTLEALPEARAFLRRDAATKGEGFAAQHQARRPTADGPSVNLKESPLARLASIGGSAAFLQPHQLEAGQRFARLFERAALRQRTTMSYDPQRLPSKGKGGRASADVSEMSIDARRQIDRIYRALPPECAAIVADICGFEKGLQQVEQERGWPRRSAKLVLRIALEQLAQHFGLSSVARGAGRSGLSTWRPDAARPTVLGWEEDEDSKQVG